MALHHLRVDHGVELAVHDDWFGSPWLEPAGTIAFVHGVGESSLAWQAWIPELAGRWRCLRIDLPGFGGSTVASRDLTFLTPPRIAGYVARAVAALATGPTVLVSAKMGGIIAVLAADRFPALFSGGVAIGSFLVAGDTNPTDDADAANFSSLTPEMEAEGFGRWAQRTMPARLGSDGTPQAIAWWSRTMGDANEALCIHMSGEAARIDLRASLARLALPFLLVGTEGSPMVSPEVLASWARLGPGLETVVLPGDGYQLAYSRVPESAAVVRRFIEEHRLLPDPV